MSFSASSIILSLLFQHFLECPFVNAAEVEPNNIPKDDLALMKRLWNHPAKIELFRGVDPQMLQSEFSYVPNDYSMEPKFDATEYGKEFKKNEIPSAETAASKSSSGLPLASDNQTEKSLNTLVDKIATSLSDQTATNSSIVESTLGLTSNTSIIKPDGNIQKDNSSINSSSSNVGAIPIENISTINYSDPDKINLPDNATAINVTTTLANGNSTVLDLKTPHSTNVSFFSDNSSHGLSADESSQTKFNDSVININSDGKETPKIEHLTSSQLDDTNETKTLDEPKLHLPFSMVNKSLLLCEDGKTALKCESHHLINIDYVFWGRLEAAKCVSEQLAENLIAKRKDSKCKSSRQEVTDKVKSHCQNEQECNIYANDSFLQPLDCNGWPKYMFVKYQCLHSESRIKAFASKYIDNN